MNTGPILGIIILLIIAYLAYRYWEAKHVGPPINCGDYPPGPLTDMCQTAARACAHLEGRDRGACEAAAKACMPVARAAYDYTRTVKNGLGGSEDWASLFNRVAPHVPDCVDASLKISPAGAAKAFKAAGGPANIIPPGAAPFFQDPETRGNVEMVAEYIPAATGWTLDFGDGLVGDPPGESFVGYDGGAAESFTANTAGGFSVACTPLCPRPECYADMDCGPQGYCQAYFADDPTQGGRCVPA